MKPLRGILLVPLFTVMLGIARADFRPRSGEYLVADIESAQSEARSGNKPLTFILTNPNTTCGAARSMFNEVHRGLRGRSILVFCNSSAGADRSMIPPMVTTAFSAPASGRFIPKTVVVDAEITRVLAHIPYTADQRERARLLREARSMISEYARSPTPTPAQPAGVDKSGSRIWTDINHRRVRGEYVSNTATQVTIRIEDGTEIEVDLNMLSPADQRFISAADAP